VLLAAGLGTRLRPLTLSMPKCMVPINGKPLLGYWLDSLRLAGIGPILLNLHYHADQVKQFVESSGHDDEVQMVYETSLLGTAGTLRANSGFFSEEPTLVIHADNFCLSNITDFIKTHKQRPDSTEMTMMTFLTNYPEQCGIVELDTLGIVQSFHEKQSSPLGNIANGAVYVFESSVIDFICTQEKSYLDISLDVLPNYCGRIYTWSADGFHIDVGTKVNLEEANCYIRQLGQHE